MNLTNHTYWNLAGAGSGTMLAQEARFNCPFYLPVDKDLMPTGEILKTAGNPFDFSSYKAIGRDIEAVPGGYDHCLVVGKHGGDLDLVGTVRDPSSGRTMEVHTTMPGRAALHGQFPRRLAFPEARRILPGDAVVPRQREHRPLPLVDPAAGRHLPPPNGAQVFVSGAAAAPCRAPCRGT